MLLCVCIYAFSNPNAVDSSIFLQINNIVVAHWISAAAATAIIYIAIQSQQFFAFYWKNKVEQRISLSISFPNTRVFCHLNRMKTDAVTLIIPNANAIFCFFQYSTISVYLCETDVESTTGLEAHTNKLHALSFVVFIAYRLFVSLQLHLSLLQTFGGMMMNWNGDVMEWYTALWNAQLKLISSKRDRENGANYFQGCFICTACEWFPTSNEGTVNYM